MEDKKIDSQQNNVKTKNEKIAVLKQAAQDRLKVIKIMSIPLISIFAIQLAAGVILSQVKNKENPNPTFDANKEAELSIRNSESLTPESLSDYKNNPEVTKLIFSKKTKNIKAEAFKDFKNIEEIIFREGCQLDSIGKDAFKGMTNLKKITFEDPNAITVFDLREYTKFENVQYGKDIDPSSKIETKDQYLARWNKEVLSANDLKDVKTISYNAFSFNTNLKEVDLKSSKVSSIGQDAFQGTTLETIKFSNYFKEITNDSFKGMNTLKNVELGLNTTIIGNGAFEDTTSLEHIDLSNTQLSKVGNNAFKNSGIKNFIAPDTLKEIGDNAFNGALNLENVELSTLTKLGSLAFANSQNIKKFDVHKFNKFLPSNFENLKIKHLVIGDSIKKLSKETIDGFELQKVSFKDVNELIDDLFLDNATLQEVDFGDKMEIIGNNAFKNCRLTALTLPSTLKRIGKASFENVKLENLELPASLNFVGVNAFNNCGLKNVNFDLATNADLHAYSFANNDFTELRLTSILDLDKKLDINTFKGCSKIKKILLSDDTVLPQYFYKEYVADSRIALEEIFIPKSLVEKSYDENNLSKWFLEFANLVFTTSEDHYTGKTFTFINNEKNHDIYKNLRSITYGKGCHNIANIFHTLYLDNLNVKDDANINLKFVGINLIFNNMNVNQNEINKVSLSPFEEEYVSTKNFSLYKINNTYVGENINAFSSSHNPLLNVLDKLRNSITKLVIPGFVENVDGYSFDQYSSEKSRPIFEELVLEEGVKTIRSNSFSNLPYLKKIVLPSSLESIGSNCFNNLPNLEEIVWPSTTKIETINQSFNSSVFKLKKLILPEGIKEIYDSFALPYTYDSSNNIAEKYSKEIELPFSLGKISGSFNNIPNISRINIKSIETIKFLPRRSQYDLSFDKSGYVNADNMEWDTLTNIIRIKYDSTNKRFIVPEYANYYSSLLSSWNAKKIIFEIDNYDTTDQNAINSNLNEVVNSILNKLNRPLGGPKIEEIMFKGPIKYADFYLPNKQNNQELYTFDSTILSFSDDVKLDYLGGNWFRHPNRFKNKRLPISMIIDPYILYNNDEIETLEMSCTASFRDYFYIKSPYNKDDVDRPYYLFKGNTKLTKIRLYDLDNLELNLETINISGVEYKYIVPSDEYYNKIKNNPTLEWKGSIFVFKLLGLQKYDKKLILNNDSSDFKIRSYSYIPKWDEEFSKKFSINELEIKDCHNFSMSVFNGLTFENITFSKKINKYNWFKDNSYDDIVIKKINGKSEVELSDFAVKYSNDENYSILEFLKGFTGKIKVSSEINKFTWQIEKLTNYMFSELEISNGITKPFPIFAFKEKFERDHIENISLAPDFDYKIIETYYSNIFGIKKINNKSEWNYQEFNNKIAKTKNINLLYLFNGKMIINTKLNNWDNDNVYLLQVFWTELELKNGYEPADNTNSGAPLKGYYRYLQKIVFDTSLNLGNKSLLSFNSSSDYFYQSKEALNNFSINGISNTATEINLKNVLTTLGTQNLVQLSMLFNGSRKDNDNHRPDFSNTKLIIPVGYDFSKLNISYANFKEIEIQGNVEANKLPNFIDVNFTDKSPLITKLKVDNVKFVNNSDNVEFWNKLNYCGWFNFNSINDMTEIDLENWKTSYSNFLGPLVRFTGKLVISSNCQSLLFSNDLSEFYASIVEIKNGITSIQGNVFTSKYLKKLILPSTLKSFGLTTFYNFQIDELILNGFDTSQEKINIKEWLAFFNNNKESINLLASLANKKLLIPKDFNIEADEDIMNKIVDILQFKNLNELIFEEGTTALPAKFLLAVYNTYLSVNKEISTIIIPKSINDFSGLTDKFPMYRFDIKWYKYLKFNLLNDNIENLDLNNYINNKFSPLIFGLIWKAKNINISLDNLIELYKMYDYNLIFWLKHANKTIVGDTKLTITNWKNFFNGTKSQIATELISLLYGLKTNDYNYDYKVRDDILLELNVDYSFSTFEKLIEVLVQLNSSIWNVKFLFNNDIKYSFSIDDYRYYGRLEYYDYKNIRGIGSVLNFKNLTTPKDETLNYSISNGEIGAEVVSQLMSYSGSKIFFSKSLNNYSDSKYFSSLPFNSGWFNNFVKEIEFEEGTNLKIIKLILDKFIASSKFTALQKIIIPSNIELFDDTLYNYEFRNYVDRKFSNSNPLTFEFKSFKTYFKHNHFMNINSWYDKIKIVYEDNFEFKFDKVNDFIYLKPQNFTKVQIDKSQYLNKMNLYVKYILWVLNYLPSLGDLSKLTINKEMLLKASVSEMSSFIWNISYYQQQLLNKNDITFDEVKITTDAFEVFSNLGSSLFSKGYTPEENNALNITINNLILEQTTILNRNVGRYWDLNIIKVKKINGSNTLNYNDFYNKWPKYLLASNINQKIVISDGTNYSDIDTDFTFRDVDTLEFGENVTFDNNSILKISNVKKLIMPESTIRNMVNYMKSAKNDPYPYNRLAIRNRLFYKGFIESINGLTEINLSEWIEKYSEDVWPLLYNFKGKVIVDKNFDMAKYGANNISDNDTYKFSKFWGAAWTEIQFENGIEYIPANVFLDLNNLRKIIFPNDKLNINSLNFIISNVKNIEIINESSVVHNLTGISKEYTAIYNGVKLFSYPLDRLHTNLNKLIISEGYEKLSLNNPLYDFPNLMVGVKTGEILDKFTLELPSTIDMIYKGSFDYLFNWVYGNELIQYTKAIEIKIHADDEKFAKIKKLIEDSLIDIEYLKSITIIQEN